MKRRDIIKSLSLLPFAGRVPGNFLSPQLVKASPYGKKRNLFEELGVRTFINAAGEKIAAMVHSEAGVVTSGAFFRNDLLSITKKKRIILLQ